MKRLLLGTAILLVVAIPAAADNITLTATADGVLVDTINSGGLPTLDVSNVAFGGVFNNNSLTINSAGALAAPGKLDGNTIDVDAATGGNHTLVLDITATGLAGTASLQSFLSEFSVTGLTTGWSVMEQTFINGAPLASTPLITANSFSLDSNNPALETNPFSAEERFTITSDIAGQFNGGIDINASAVPGPVLGTGLPALFGIGLLWLGSTRRQRSWRI
jgi:hypothetical protein